MRGRHDHRRLLLAGLLALAVPAAFARAESIPQTDVPAGTPAHWVIGTHDCDQRVNGWCQKACPRFFFQQAQRPLREVEGRTFKSSLRPGAPVIFFVHGSFLQWKSSVADAAETFRWLEEHRNCDGPRPHYVSFSWPSDPITTVLPSVDVNILGRRASLNGYYLARVVNELPPDTPVTFMGHSHGTRVSAAALHVLGGGDLWDHRIPRQRLTRRQVRTVFIAAALDRHWMYPGQRYSNSLYAADGLVHLKNPDDVVLDIYPLRRPFAKRALGQVGFDGTQLAKFGHAARGIVEIDVSNMIGKGHTWNHYLERPEIAKYLGPYVFHEVPVVTQRP